jgi:methyl-accepting chemotaxis protein
MQMDQVTQQNAALVEESSGASEAMSQQARDLRTLVQQFKIDRRANSTLPLAAAASAPRPQPVVATGTHGNGKSSASRASGRKPSLVLTTAPSGSTAAKSDQGFEEF